MTTIIASIDMAAQELQELLRHGALTDDQVASMWVIAMGGAEESVRCALERHIYRGPDGMARLVSVDIENQKLDAAERSQESHRL